VHPGSSIMPGKVNPIAESFIDAVRSAAPVRRRHRRGRAAVSTEECRSSESEHAAGRYSIAVGKTERSRPIGKSVR